MNLGTRCRFARDCDIFKGKVVVSDIPLPLYRNVFCNRGMKGWKNCDEYNRRTENNETVKK